MYCCIFLLRYFLKICLSFKYYTVKFLEKRTSTKKPDILVTG